jgi:hypothetical protein
MRLSRYASETVSNFDNVLEIAETAATTERREASGLTLSLWT